MTNPTFRLSFLAAAAAALAACVIPVGTPPAPAPTAAPVAPPPIVAGVPIAQANVTANATLKTTSSSLNLASGEERLLMDLLRDGAGLAPTSGVTWLTSDAQVVTVNPLSGQAKAIGNGTAIITASLQANPAAKTQITVTVGAENAITKITITPATVAMAVGEQKTLSATVYSADGTITSNVVWASSDETLAKVNSGTGVVQALKVGKVTIEAAAAANGGYKGIAIVTIAAATAAPSATPTTAATEAPTPEPSASPSASPSPSAEPTAEPTASPSASPAGEG